MAARKDQVQISIAFLTDESKEYAKLIQENQKFVADIQKAKKEGKDLTEVIRQMAASGQSISKIPLDKLAPAQLVTRANQLKQVLDLIPQSAPEYAQLAAEYKKINDLLAEQRVRTRGVAEAMNSSSGLLGISGRYAALLGRFAPLIGGVIAGFQALRGAITGAAQLEQLNIAFEVFLGSAEKAKRVVLDLRRFADVTPFETEQVNSAGRSLLAFGFTAQDLIPTLTKVGNVAAGTGKDFGELALIYGKARAEGLIQNDTLNQLAEAGIPIYAELAKVLKVNESQIRKLAEQGKIGFKDLEQVFTNLTAEGGRFAGLMEKQSQSVGGLYSTLKSGLNNLLTEFGTVLAPLVKRGLEVLIVAVEGLGAVARPVFNFFRTGFEYIADASRSIVPFFTDTLPGAIARTLRSAEQIPGIGGFITALLAPIRLVIDGFESLSATATGVVAALQDVFTTGGRNAGKAYAEARAKALEEERQVAARDAAENARDDRQLTAKEQAELLELERKAAAERAAIRQKEADERRKNVKEAIALELQQVDIQFAKEELTALKLKQDGILADETKFGNVMLILEEQQLEARLAVYRRYGQDQTKEALDLQAKLIEIQTGRQQRPTVAPLDVLPTAGPAPVQSQGTDRIEALAQASGNAEVSAIRDKFALIVDLEQQHELRIAEIRRNAADERLRMLLEAGLSETEEYKKAQQEKLKADEDYSKKRLENEQRTAELKKKVEQAATDATADAFAVAVDLLSQDEKARKRNASAIKAFQSAQVITNGILEVQKIWASVAEFGPAAPVIGGILTAVAVARAGIALGKIQAAKFAGGGYTGPGAGVTVDSTGHRPVGVVHNDEWVGPKWMTQHPVWGHQIAVLESVRQRGYAQGGYATTPTVNIVPGAAAGSAGAASMEGLVALADEFRGFRREIRDWQGRLRVSYTDIEDVGAEVSKVRTEASI